MNFVYVLDLTALTWPEQKLIRAKLESARAALAIAADQAWDDQDYDGMKRAEYTLAEIGDLIS